VTTDVTQQDTKLASVPLDAHTPMLTGEQVRKRLVEQVAWVPFDKF
jgi:hypothetical protein